MHCTGTLHDTPCKLSSTQPFAAAGPLQYNPVSDSPRHAPSQPRYTPTQSPERPATSVDPLAFLERASAQSQSHTYQRSGVPPAAAAARTRPAYQPPPDAAPAPWMPPQQQAKVRFATVHTVQSTLGMVHSLAFTLWCLSEWSSSDQPSCAIQASHLMHYKYSRQFHAYALHSSSKFVN